MKTRMNQVSRKITATACALSASLAFLAVPGAFAQATDTWVGNTSANLSDANWTGGNTTPLNGDNWVFGAAGTAGAVLNNSFAAGITVSNILFNGPGAFTFASAVNPLILTGGISNASTALQTFNLPISNAAPSGLTLTLNAGGGNITIGGILSGSSNLILAGAGTVTLTNTNNFSGALTVGSTNTLAISGPLAALGTNANTTVITTSYTTNAGVVTTNYTTNIYYTNYFYGANIANNGTIIYSSGLNQTNTGVISGGGTNGIVVNSGVFAIANGANTFTNNIVVNGGRLSATAGAYSGSRTVNTTLGNQTIDGRSLTINNGGVVSFESANVFASSGTANHLAIYINQGGLLQIIGAGEDELFTNLYLNGATINIGPNINGNWYYPAAIFGGSVNVGGSSPTYLTAGTFGTGSGSTTANGGNGTGWGLGYTGSTGYQTPFNVAATAGGSGSGGADLIISATLYNMANQASVFSGILKTNTGTMLLTGSNLFTGPITVGNGSLIIGGAGNLNSNSFPGSITVSNGASFAYGSSAAQTFSGAINNSGGIAITNPAQVLFSGAIINNGGITLSGAAPVLFEAAPFSGTGGVTNNGTGTVYFMNNNSYTGLTAINAGQAVFFSSQTGTAPVTVSDGASLAVVASPGGTTGFSPATLSVGSVNGASVSVVINSAMQAPLTAGALNLVGSNSISVGASVALAAGQSYPVLSYKSISGSLAAANFTPPAGVTGTFSSSASSGVTTWRFSVGSVASPLTWTGVQHSGGFGVWDINTTANWKSGGSAVNFQNGQPVLFDDTASFFTVGGTATVSPSGVTFNNSANNYGLLPGVVIAGTGGITLNGSDSVTNAAVDLYTGATLINNGTFVAGTNSVGLGGPLGAFYAPVSLSNSATAALNLNGYNVQVGSVSGGGSAGGNIALGSGTLTVGVDGTSQTYGGVISGSGGLTMTGPGSLTLTNTSTFTGPLTLGAGNTLTISNTALGSLVSAGNYNLPNAITDNGTIVYSSSMNQTNSGVISGNGGLIVNGPGTFALNNVGNTFTNNVVVNGGTLLLGAGTYGNRANSALGNQRIQGRTVTVNNGGVVMFNNLNVFAGGTYAQTISFIVNQGGLVEVMYSTENEAISNLFLNGGTLFAGPGTGQAAYQTFMLESNVYVGGAVPSYMTAAVPATATGGNGIGYAIGAGAAAGYQMGFVVSNTAGGSLAGGADLIVSGSLLNTSANPTTRACGFIMSGGGTMLLSGTNFFTGNITINSGTVNLGGAGQLLGGSNFAGNIAINSNSTFLFSSSLPQPLSGVISGTGTLLVSNPPGSGLTLTNDVNTLAGPAVIAAGTLFLAGTASISNVVISNGAVLDVTQVATNFTSGSAQTVMGSGNVNGNFTSMAGGIIEGGLTNASGTLTFNNNLTLGPASGFRFVLSSSATSSQNSQVLVTGTLACSGAQMHVAAPSGQNLDTRNYALVTAGSIAGASFSPAVAWDVAPANQNHYYITNINNNVVLAYSSIPLPTPGGVTTPTLVLRNQTPLLVVTVVPGNGTVTNVSVNASGVGGPSFLPLTPNGVANTWTNSVSIPPTLLPGSYLLPATAIDTVPVTGYGAVSVFVVASAETWVGAGANGNFDTAANWAIESGQPAASAPGYVGDSLVFAGTTGLSPIMDLSYTVNGVGFTNGAGKFVITATGTNVLTLTGGITNLSSNPEALNVPVLIGTTAPEIINTAGGNLALSNGVADLNGGLTVIGSNTFTLAGASTFTGPLVVRQGAMTLAGSTTANTNPPAIANAAGSNAVLTLGSGGALNITNTGRTGTWATDGIVINAASNSTGVLNITNGGSFTTSMALQMGGGQGGYSYVNLTGGTMQTGSFIYVGGAANDRARFDMSGGVLNVLTNCISIVGGAYGTGSSLGVMNFSGNAVLNSAQTEGPDFAYGARGGLYVGEFGVAILNVMGNAILNVAGDTNVSIGVGNAGAQAGSPNGTINLLGGAIVTAQVVGGVGGSTFNFNGGLLSNYTGTINWNGYSQGPYFMYNVSNTYVYPGGAFIDDGGGTITINEALQAPSGYGVASIAVNAAGAGYIAPPFVTITGGTGGGASAIAVISNGAVTGFTVTCPGTGYSSGDSLTVTLTNGGYTTVATAKTPVLALNGSGGLTYTSQAGAGAGTLTLNAPAAYTNATIIKSGTLQIGPGGSINNSAVYWVSNGATLNASASGGLTLGAGQAIKGSGTVQGPVTATSGSQIYPGADPAIGKLAFNSGLNMGIGAIVTFNLSASGTGANDQVVINGNQSLLSFANNSIHIKVPSTSASLDTAIPYALFQNNSALNVGGLPNVVPVFDVAPANQNSGYWLIQPNGNGIVLKNSTVAPPTGTGSITAGATSGTNVIRNTTIAVSATINPSGSRTVQTVTVDLSAYGGAVTHLTQGAGNTWSGTLTVPPGVPPGPFNLAILAYDGTLYGEVSLALNVLTIADTWSGADFVNQQVSDDNLNWVGGAAPGYAGDSAIFAGATGLAPIFDQNYSFNGIGFASNAGPFVLTSFNTIAVVGGITNNSANIETVNFPLTVTGANMFLNGAAGSLVLNNTVSGSGQLNVAGAGSVTLAGMASYTGSTFVASGATLILGTNGLWVDNLFNQNSYAGAMTNNGTFVYNSAGTQTNAGIISGNGGVIVNGPGTLVARAANSFTNNLVINGGVLSCLYEVGTTGSSGFGATAVDGRYVIINNGGVASLDGAGGNVFGGGTTTHHVVFVVNPGGILQVTSGNDVFTNIILNGGTALAAPTSSILASQWGNFDLAASIIVGGTNSSTMAGSTAGTVSAAIGYCLGVNAAVGYQTPFIVASTGSSGPDLTVSGSLFNTDNNTANGTGILKTGAGTMALTGTNFFAGPITVGNGTVMLSGGGQLNSYTNTGYAGNIVISNGATFAFENLQAQTYTGVISGAGTLLVSNTSSPGLSLSTVETITGPVVISGGTLSLATGGSLASSSGVSIAGGGTFDVSGLASPYVWPAASSVTAGGTAANPAVINSPGAVSLSSSSAIVLAYNDTNAAPQPALNINGNLTLGGNAFTVNTADGKPLASGTYVLIQASGTITSSGAYPAVTGTAIGTGVGGAITVNGSQVLLTVGSSINTNPPPMQFSRAGTVLTLSWPTNSGWTLESNSINVAVTNDWFRIPGTSAVTNFQINLTAVKTNVFYRLVYP